MPIRAGCGNNPPYRFLAMFGAPIAIGSVVFVNYTTTYPGTGQGTIILNSTVPLTPAATTTITAKKAFNVTAAPDALQAFLVPALVQQNRLSNTSVATLRCVSSAFGMHGVQGVPAAVVLVSTPCLQSQFMHFQLQAA